MAAAGVNDAGRCSVSNWKNIVSVSAGYKNTLGLKSDGTAVAVGENKEKGFSGKGQCDVTDPSWSNLTALIAGPCYSCGLKNDGTVLGAGKLEFYGYQGWHDIIDLACADDCLLGLIANGTVLADDVHARTRGTPDWHNIIAIAGGWYHYVGLRSDGTVVAMGKNDYGQCNVETWNNIVAIAAGLFHTIGLRADGIIVSTGDNRYGQCNLNGLRLFNNLDTIDVERKEATERAERERRESAEREQRERMERIAILTEERSTLQNKLATLRGFFSGKRRREIEVRIAAIEAEIKATTAIDVKSAEKEGEDASVSTSNAIFIDSPMPGKIVKVFCTVGQRVRRGDTLLLLEAFGMNNEIMAHQDGVVKQVCISAGQKIISGESLVVLEV